MSQLGVWVMLRMLSGDEDSVKALSSSSGKEISSLSPLNQMPAGFFLYGWKRADYPG